MAGLITTQSLAFSRKCENICNENFAFLTGVTTWFLGVTGKTEFSTTDYLFFDAKQRSGTIELKTRKIVVDKYSYLFIEPDKLAALKNSQTQKKWYINFTENSKKKFWICDVDKLPSNLKIKKNVEIKKQYDNNDYKVEDRVLIPINCGKYYEYNELTEKYEKKEYNEITCKFNR